MNTGQEISLVDIARRLRESPPNVDPITAGAIDFYEFSRSMSDAYPMQFAPLSKHIKALHQELQEKLLATGAKVAEGHRDIPRVPPETLSESDFEEFIKNPCPVIFEGAARDVQAVREWSPAFFKQNYGNHACLLATETDWDIKGTLADAVDDILSGTEVSRYAHNIANVFNEHPDLEAQLELQRFLPHLGPGRHLGTHLFLGGSRTGTAFHCANNLNIFFNVHGQKEWFFVHPKHTFWMYGVLQANGAAGDSEIDHNQPASAQREKFPLFEQVPVYSARLNPGDVLINPPWWWHAINNLTPSTIGCAVRWIPEGIGESNPVFSVAQRMVPHAKEVMRVLRDPKARLTDELYRATFEPIRRER
jgi:hypothetical protein